MPTLFVFLLKVNIALLLFCAGYYLVLRHLTFYSLNRVYLVTAIIFATLYPKIDLTAFAQRHEELTKPVQSVAVIWQAPAQKLATHTDYWQWAELVFWVGAALLTARLVVQLFSLYKLYRRSTPAQIHNHDVRLMDGEAAPFSFWRSIYVNPANHSATDLKAILLHEQVHVNGLHTVDILLAELSSIFYWFNPGIWLMKRAVRENIEFITDRKILNKGFDSKAYQYSLVNVSFNNTTPGIVNHFNISTIKKRIIMMNAKRSSRFNLTRYAFVVPAVMALLLVFTLSKADVAKPLSIKLSNAIKPVTAVIKQVSFSALAMGDTAPVKRAKPAAPFTTKPDTQRFTQTFAFTTTTDINHKTDTGKKDKVVINLRSNNMIDSMNIVLNGKKVDNAIFSKVDPSTIQSINIINATQIKGNPLIQDLKFNNDKSVIFVITKDSEGGKALQQKLNIGSPVNRIRIDGVEKDPKNLTEKDKALLAKLPALKATVSAVHVYAGQPLQNIKDDKYAAITFDSKPSVNNVTILKGYNSQLKGKSDSIVTVVGYATGGPATTNINRVYTMNADPAYVATRATGFSKALSIRTVDRISDKLIVINGKEASESEMKKLSAFDIDRMSISADADTVKKYGDKAKYGVVFIYTKKGK